MAVEDWSAKFARDDIEPSSNALYCIKKRAGSEWPYFGGWMRPRGDSFEAIFTTLMQVMRVQVKAECSASLDDWTALTGLGVAQVIARGRLDKDHPLLITRSGAVVTTPDKKRWKVADPDDEFVAHPDDAQVRTFRDYQDRYENLFAALGAADPSPGELELTGRHAVFVSDLLVEADAFRRHGQSCQVRIAERVGLADRPYLCVQVEAPTASWFAAWQPFADAVEESMSEEIAVTEPASQP